jgi:peptidoglycan/LPS O-acetylase OafA/YrhL
MTDSAATPHVLTLAEASSRTDNNFNLLRLVAAWAVIYGHSHAVAVWGGPDVVARFLQFKFSGAIAVHVFFVISGFLIAASLERNRLPAFLLSRALRIFPGLLACVAAWVFVLGPLLTTVDDYWRHPEVLRYFAANVGLSMDTAYFLPGVFSGMKFENVNSSLWSLPVEARLYLGMAALGVFALNRRARFNPLFLTTLLVGFLVLSPRPMQDIESRVYYCVAFFFTGAFAWLNRDEIPLSWPLLLAIMVLAAALHGTSRFFVGYALLLAYGTLFLAYVPRLPVIRHHDFSYGLYLWGWPSQQLVQMFVPTAGPVANTIGATLVAGVFAVASWFLVEAPAMRLKSRFRVRAHTASPDAGSTTMHADAVRARAEDAVVARAEDADAVRVEAARHSDVR